MCPFTIFFLSIFWTKAVELLIKEIRFRNSIDFIEKSSIGVDWILYLEIFCLVIMLGLFLLIVLFLFEYALYLGGKNRDPIKLDQLIIDIVIYFIAIVINLVLLTISSFIIFSNSDNIYLVYLLIVLQIAIQIIFYKWLKNRGLIISKRINTIFLIVVIIVFSMNLYQLNRFVYPNVSMEKLIYSYTEDNYVLIKIPGYHRPVQAEVSNNFIDTKIPIHAYNAYTNITVLKINLNSPYFVEGKYNIRLHFSNDFFGKDLEQTIRKEFVYVFDGDEKDKELYLNRYIYQLNQLNLKDKSNQKLYEEKVKSLKELYLGKKDIELIDKLRSEISSLIGSKSKGKAVQILTSMEGDSNIGFRNDFAWKYYGKDFLLSTKCYDGINRDYEQSICDQIPEKFKDN